MHSHNSNINLINQPQSNNSSNNQDIKNSNTQHEPENTLNHQSDDNISDSEHKE
jgi:hypothetical protein